MVKILTVAFVLLVIGSVSGVNVVHADIWTDFFDNLIKNYEELYLDLRTDYDTLASDYDSLNSEYTRVFSDYSDLAFDYDTLASDYDSLNSEYTRVFSDYSDLAFDYDTLASDYDSLNSEYTRVFSDYSDLAFDYDTLASDYNDLYSEYDQVYSEYDQVYSEYDQLLDELYPKTTISDTQVHWEFYDSKGNFYSWSMPIHTFEESVKNSAYHTYQQTYVDPHLLSLHGKTFTTLNLDGFLQRSFPKVIDQIYDNSYDSTDFIREVWYIVSQMTVYDTDVNPGSNGRYALETFTRTGGDCEDLVILIADMLMSSSHTKNWEFKYVYMDSYNPTDPQKMNHVILHVNDGQYDYNIEATAPPKWDYFPNGVNGWRFDVV